MQPSSSSELRDLGVRRAIGELTQQVAIISLYLRPLKFIIGCSGVLPNQR